MHALRVQVGQTWCFGWARAWPGPAFAMPLTSVTAGHFYKGLGLHAFVLQE